MKTLKIYKSKHLGDNTRIIEMNDNGKISYSTIIVNQPAWKLREGAPTHEQWLATQKEIYDTIEIIDGYTDGEKTCFINVI